MDEREAGAYQFLTDKLEVVHTSSVPTTDKQALLHLKLVQCWFPSERVQYITKRNMNGREFTMLPVEIIDGEVFEIVQPQPQVS